MQLTITGIGRYIGDESSEEKGLIMINKGAIILLVDNAELAKVVPYFKPKTQVESKQTQKEAEDDFYVDPNFVTDDELAQVQDDNTGEYYEDSEDSIDSY